MNIKLLIFNPLRTENRSLVRQRLNLIKIQYMPILVCNKSKILETGTHCQKTLLEIIIHQGINYLTFFSDSVTASSSSVTTAFKVTAPSSKSLVSQATSYGASLSLQIH